ncbi:MAG: hypothetical protein LBN12_03050 [Clostridiales Family XIII bacterium]|nr:hypothetical protein [Clostridiales Family XIII bacterium]
MATESFGKVVHMDDEFADRYLAAEAAMKANPPKPSNHKIKWADPKELIARLRKEYQDEK